MNHLDLLTEEFQNKLDRFLIGCDSIEELDRWDKEANGEMDLYYQNDLLSVILRLIAADGEVGKREVEYLNRNFGFHSTVEEVGAIYRDCCENLGDAFLQNFKNDLDTLCSINKKLFDAYRELLGLICQIIVESDWVVAEEELCEIGKLRALFS